MNECMYVCTQTHTHKDIDKRRGQGNTSAPHCHARTHERGQAGTHTHKGGGTPASRWARILVRMSSSFCSGDEGPALTLRSFFCAVSLRVRHHCPPHATSASLSVNPCCRQSACIAIGPQTIAIGEQTIAMGLVNSTTCSLSRHTPVSVAGVRGSWLLGSVGVGVGESVTHTSPLLYVNAPQHRQHQLPSCMA